MSNSNTSDPSLVREFVIAGHGNLDKVKHLLVEHPELLNVAHEWRPGDTETALQGAAHVGVVPIAEYLLDAGAPLDICAAAMLGRRYDVERLLGGIPDVNQVHGAHGISLLTHAALSGDVDLVRMLWERGATEGASSALINAVTKGYFELTEWLLRNTKPDLTLKNFQDKTALDIAQERGDDGITTLLREHAER